jgi:hypothetical protein
MWHQVEPPELGIPGAGRGRQFDALGDLGAPAVEMHTYTVQPGSVATVGVITP